MMQVARFRIRMVAPSTRFPALALVVLLTASAHAGETWDGNGSNNDWSTNNNWNPNGEPPNDGTANIVMAGTNRLSPRVDVDWDIRSLVFSNTAGGFSISGASGVSLSVGVGGIVNQDTQTQLLLLPINLTTSQSWIASQGPLSIGNTIAPDVLAARTLTLSASNNIQISGAITSLITVNKTGSGTVTYNGVTTNNYFGLTTVSAGTLVLDRSGGTNRAIANDLTIGDGFGSDIVRLDSSDQISEASGNVVTVNSSGLLNLNGFNETLRDLTLNGGSVSGGGILTLNGSISSGAAAVTATISGGTLNFAGGTRTITVADGAAAQDLVISSAVTNGALIKDGAGTLVLSGSSSNSIDATINAGTVLLNKSTAVNALGTVTVGDGVGSDVLRLLAQDQIGGSVTINSSGLLDLNGHADTVFDVTLAGGTITTGSGTLEVFSLHTYASSQPSTISGRVEGVSDRPNDVDFYVDVADGAAADDLVVDGPMTDFAKVGPGQMRLVGSAFASDPDPIDTNPSVVVNGGTLVLAKAIVDGSIERSVTVLGATLALGADEQINSTNSGNRVEMSGGTLDLGGFNETILDLGLYFGSTVVTGGGTLVARNLTLAQSTLDPATGLVTINGTISVPNIYTDSGSFIGGNVNITLADKVIDVGNALVVAIELEIALPLGGASLTKTGTGTLLLSGAANNTYSGATTVSGGMLLLGKSAVDGAIPADLAVTGATVQSTASEQIATSGVVTLNAGGVLDLNGFTETIGRLSLNGGTVTTGAGTLVVTGSISQSASAAASISGRLGLGGGTRVITSNDVPVAAVDLDIPAEVINGGIIKQGAGTLRLGGNSTFAGGFQLQVGKLLIAHDNSLGTGSFTLAGGTVEADGGARNISNSVVLAIPSTVSGSNALTFGGSFITNLGATLLKSGTGTLTIAGPQTHASGATLFATAGMVNFDSSATGATLGVNLSNAGTLVNFSADQELNSLVINGGRVRVSHTSLLGASNLSIATDAVLDLEIGGLIAGSQFAQLFISGNASLAGTLQITLVNGFSPTAGNSFDILNWGSRSGTFNTITLSALGAGLMWNTSQLYVTGMLNVNITGDYNSNGVVDAADYVVWRKTLGQTGTGLAADGNANNQIDSGDLDIWRARFGQPPGSGSSVSINSAVPEPATMVLLMFTAAGCCLRQRRAG